MVNSQNYVNLHVGAHKTFFSFIGIVEMSSKERALTGKSDPKKSF
jgi:hypothetical protein